MSGSPIAQLPLVVHGDAAEIVAFYRHSPVSLAQFLNDVALVAALLPTGQRVLNATVDRYHFTVGFAAAALARCVTVLPPSYAPEAIARLQDDGPVCCLSDAEVPVALPNIPFPRLLALDSAPDRSVLHIPHIPADQTVATVFTSGTTGAPVDHHKTWGSLVAGAREEAQRLGLGPGCALVGTVPPQHMYGLESTVMLGLHGGGVISAERPFYPRDIVAALSEVSRPRLLVTSPVHLRALLTSGLELPAADALLCATAPLSRALAEEAEQRFKAPLFEIYGATEAGQIASRRPARDPLWELFPDLTLDQRQDQFWVSGGHVREPAPLNDLITLNDARRFVLEGRGNDVVNVAGKRSSLAFLEQQLLAIPGVVDGVFYMPDEDVVGPVARLMAFVVAPGLTPVDLDLALRRRIDPAFLPRPLYFVDSLPRLPTGKLPLATLKAWISGLSQEVRRDRA